MPIFDGFREEAEVAKARARETQARAHLERVKQQVMQEVRSAYAEFVGARDALPILQRQFQLAE